MTSIKPEAVGNRELQLEDKQNNPQNTIQKIIIIIIILARLALRGKTNTHNRIAIYGSIEGWGQERETTTLGFIAFKNDVLTRELPAQCSYGPGSALWDRLPSARMVLPLGDVIFLFQWKTRSNRLPSPVQINAFGAR